MYVSMTPLLAEATRVGYTVGAFNAHNLEMVPPMIRAAAPKIGRASCRERV